MSELDLEFPGWRDGDFGDAMIEKLKVIDERARAKKKALELCTRAEQHRAGLFAKLIARGFSIEAVRYSLESLEEEGLLDDLRYCRLWAHARLALRPQGPRNLAAELAGKGLPLATIKKAIGEIDFSEYIRKAAEREAKKKDLGESALRSLLRSQGFSGDQIENLFNDGFKS
jgi:SOS response regulatory protein OraA/RecX